MGCLISNDPNKHIHTEIESGMKQLKLEETQVKKLLLLGSGSSGKSTIFKQLKCIHGPGLDDNEKEECTQIIRQNLVTGIITILRKSHEIYETNPELYANCKLDLDDPKITPYIEIILKMSVAFNEDVVNASDNLNNLPELGYAIAELWKLSPVQNTYAQRGFFSFPDNMDYFFGKVIDVMNSDYHPSFEDVLKARIRTTGMIEYKFQLEENSIIIYDVGGQRNERKKWIHSFDQVTAVIFVAALNHYNSVLFEDEKKNAMHESLELFREVCNSKWFRKTEMILFLNKQDLFRNKLREGFSLKSCFTIPHWLHLQWNGPDYDPEEAKQLSKEDDDKKFELCFISAVNFIQAQYVEQNYNKDKAIFAHITTATDQNNVKKVFWDVQSIVIRNNLYQAQLI